MSTKRFFGGFTVLFIVGMLGLLLFRHTNFAVLDAKGVIAAKERNLMIIVGLLSLVVVIPVFALTGIIVWKYRATNTDSTYTPDWDHNGLLETIWWGFPLLIIMLLSVITWQSTHALDPYHSLSSTVKPITIQVVALQWKWLFIYPDSDIATVNYVNFPANTPIDFAITSDAPMNSFWIPQLGGQIYAMTGMSNHLHLMADAPGSYRGMSANLSGRGFSDMHFTANSLSAADYTAWKVQASTSQLALTPQAYDKLLKPGTHNTTTYGAVQHKLYDTILMKSMSEPSDQMGMNQ